MWLSFLPFTSQHLFDSVALCILISVFLLFTLLFVFSSLTDPVESVDLISFNSPRVEAVKSTQSVFQAAPSQTKDASLHEPSDVPFNHFRPIKDAYLDQCDDYDADSIADTNDDDTHEASDFTDNNNDCDYNKNYEYVERTEIQREGWVEIEGNQDDLQQEYIDLWHKLESLPHTDEEEFLRNLSAEQLGWYRLLLK